MSTPFLAEIRIASFNFAPKGWAFCNGNVLPINQNQALFSILGTTFGGNGQNTFGLPDFRGRTALHVGAGFSLGQIGGEEGHTLLTNEMPSHVHSGLGSSSGVNAASPSNNFWASSTQQYVAPPANTPMNNNAAGNVGGSQAHENRSPFLTVNYIIALVGIYPSRN